MKRDRQKKILEIITMNSVSTQEELTQRLIAEGFHSTQATVSRDIKDLHIIKSLTKEGYRYVTSETPNLSSLDDALFSAILRVEAANNVIVLRTTPGLASAIAASIDQMRYPQILGCVAGDDTILMVAKDEIVAQEIAVKVKSRG